MTAATQVLEALSSLRQYRKDGQRAPHKPLLALLALGRLAQTGSSEVPWSLAEDRLAQLLADFGPSSSPRAQSAAYPFTHLRTDGVWRLDQDVPMDKVGPLRRGDVVGSFTPDIESALRSDPSLLREAARLLVTTQFPETLVPDVLTSVGLDVDDVLGAGVRSLGPAGGPERRRDPRWRAAVLQAWDHRCAFCGYDGRLVSAVAGIEGAHVRWFTFDGPDELDNGLAMCSLHHKLFDLGALGLDDDLTVLVSEAFTARTDAGRAVYELHGQRLQLRPGAVRPAAEHLAWHAREVFKSPSLAA
jgi:putative restriction endonuclease